MNAIRAMNRREGFKAMSAIVIVFPKRDLNQKLKRLLVKKKVKFFWALAWEKTQNRHDLPPFLSRIFCSSLLFVDDLFSVCFQERFR